MPFYNLSVLELANPMSGIAKATKFDSHPDVASRRFRPPDGFFPMPGMGKHHQATENNGVPIWVAVDLGQCPI
jgi:hypothetical protein